MVSRAVDDELKISPEDVERFADLSDDAETELIYKLIELIFAERNTLRPNS